MTVVEWAHLIADQLPNNRLDIHIFYQGDGERRIILKPLGEKYVELCKEIVA